MKIVPNTLLPASAALLLGACATGGGSGGVQPGASVTRFHMGQTIARGQIAVEPQPGGAAGSLQFRTVAAPVERELARLGWTVVQNNARSEQVAVVQLTQGTREALANRPSISFGLGGGSGGYRGGGVGVGVGATLPVGSASANTIVASELHVRIQRRSDATVVWEGRAQSEARTGTPLADQPAAAAQLASALFRDFPGESGRTIRVR